MNKGVFSYRNNALCAEALPLAELAEVLDPPFFCTSVKQLQGNLQAFTGPFAKDAVRVAYALRVHPALAVIRTFVAAGAAIAVGSSGELERALESDVHPRDILLSGVGKSRDDMISALLSGVQCLMVDSPAALEPINRAAAVLDTTASVCLRIDTKEGQTNWADLSESIAATLNAPSLKLDGFAAAFDAAALTGHAYARTCRDVVEAVRLVRGQGFDADHIVLACPDSLTTVGRGRGAYDSLIACAETLIALLGCRVTLELGASLVREASLFVTHIVQKRVEDGRTLYVLDTDTLRAGGAPPNREILPLREQVDVPCEAAFVAGLTDETPVARVDLPPLEIGAPVALLQTGGLSRMKTLPGAGRALIPEILVSGAQHAVIRRRVSVTEQMAWEAIPDWMEATFAA